MKAVQPLNPPGFCPTCNRSDHYDNVMTIGDYDTEAKAVAALAGALNFLNVFDVHQEVSGLYLPSRVGSRRVMRIDMLLEPTQRLLDAGWEHGTIGIEIKRSGVKIGQPLAQCGDYRRSAFRVGEGRIIIPDYVLLFPWVTYLGGPLESIIVQQRLGYAHLNEWGLPVFGSGRHRLFDSRDGNFHIGPSSFAGMKVGSR